MQADGYDGYRGLTERGDVALAFRWSHVRRRFYELAVAGPAPIASEALQRAELYAVEAEARGRSADERRALRQIKSQPILDAFEPWLRKKIELITSSPKRSAMRCRAPRIGVDHQISPPGHLPKSDCITIATLAGEKLANPLIGKACYSSLGSATSVNLYCFFK